MANERRLVLRHHDMLGYGGVVSGSFWIVRLSIGTPSAW